MTTEPEFKVGDEVEFELHAEGYPRWDTSQDLGGSGEWGQGIVVHIGRIYITVRLHVPSKDTTVWVWPTSSHRHYSPDQWQRPGYLRHVGAAKETTKTSEPHLCTCDLYAMMREGCSCGGK